MRVTTRRDSFHMSLANINYVCPVPPALELPKTVYRYRAIDKRLINSLILSQLWMAKPATFNDPFEPQRIFSETPFGSELARNVEEAGVLCLCKSKCNLPMWSYYGDGLRGVAVGYDLEALLKDLEPLKPRLDESPTWKYVFEVNYDSEGQRPVDEMALLRNDYLTKEARQLMFATKHSAFDHEEECRVVVQPSPDSKHDHAWSGWGEYKHAPEAVKKLVFGELTPESDREVLRRLLAGRQIEFFEARRSKRSFDIEIVAA